MTLATSAAILLGLVVAAQAQAQEPAAPPAESPPAPAAPGEVGVPVAPPPSAGQAPAAAPAPAPQPAPTPAPAPAATPTGEAAPPRFDLGGRQVEPLPPPPPPVDPGKIKVDPWRGRFWFAMRLTLTGPVGGDKPARPTLLTIGGGLDFGVRLNNRFGVGLGLSGQTHTSVRMTIPGTTDKTIRNGGMFFFDPLFVRVYFLKKRFQPLIELGGGYARARLPLNGVIHGAQIRAGVGFDGWVSSQVTIGFTTVYRLIALHMPQDGITPPHWSVGHALQGVLQLGLHW